MQIAGNYICHGKHECQSRKDADGEIVGNFVRRNRNVPGEILSQCAQ